MGTDLKLHFRFNTLTGQIEIFEVDMDSRLPTSEHEREHDRWAAEFGRLLDRSPRITEVVEGGGLLPAAHEAPSAETVEGKEQQGPRVGWKTE